MTKWHANPALLRRPVYISLADQFTEAIKAGRIAAEEKLPAHRDLAYDLDISIQTVSKAYEVLAQRGLVIGEVGRGTYVKSTGRPEQVPYIADRLPDVIDLSLITPVCTVFHLARMKEILHRLGDELPPAPVLSFRPNTIFPRHQEAASAWMAGLGMETSAQNITVTNGTSAAFNIALMSVAGPGSILAAEEICYHVIRPLCNYLGIRVRAIASDGEGMLPEALDEACRKEQIRVILLQPNLSNPTASVMSGARRQLIARTAAAHDVTIIENDIFGPLMTERPPPVAAFAKERTIYITGFTKVAVPGLRIGYIAAPDQYAAAIANRHLMANWMATPIMAEIATLWLEDGTMQRLVDWQRDALRSRHGIVTELLQDADYSTHPEALHLWLKLPQDHDEQAFVSQARVRGVAVAPSSPFSLSGHPAGAVRISVGTSETAELRKGLEIIASLLRGRPDRNILTM